MPQTSKQPPASMRGRQSIMNSLHYRIRPLLNRHYSYNTRKDVAPLLPAVGEHPNQNTTET